MDGARATWITILISVPLLLHSCPSATAQQTKFVGFINVQNAGRVNVFEHGAPSTLAQRYSVIVAANNANSSYDFAYLMHYPGEFMAANFTGFAPKILFNFLRWPNEVLQVPTNVFGYEAIVYFDGSTRHADKTMGSVYVTDLGDFDFPATYDIASTPEPETFKYTTGIWLDVDTADRLDLITCRVQYDSGMLRYAQLVSLQHPPEALNRNWQITVLKESACDSYLAKTTFILGERETYEVIYATGRNTRRLAFFWTTQNLGYWEPETVQGGVLETGNDYYYLQTADFNGDGRDDLLVTVAAETGGSVVIFELPADFRNVSDYKRHVIASGFNARNNGADGRSPGVASTFQPNTVNGTGLKPWIYVSGWDDGRAYYLEPNTEDPADWTYLLVPIVDHGPSQTVSGVTAADIDGDGYTELFVSLFNRNRVEVYTFRP